MTFEDYIFIGTLALVAYLAGSIPFGLIISKLKGVDIRQHGSGNIGATNVSRVLGKRFGYTCFGLDVLKGFIPTLIAGVQIAARLGIEAGGANTERISGVETTGGQIAWLAIGTATIIGHVFPVFLKFKGGKGVATSLGVVLGIWPYYTITGLVIFLIWVAIWGWTRTVSIASIVSAAVFPVFLAILTFKIPGWNFDEMQPLFIFSIVLALLVIIRHKSNIARLLAGTEHGGQTKPDTTDTATASQDNPSVEQ